MSAWRSTSSSTPRRRSARPGAELGDRPGGTEAPGCTHDLVFTHQVQIKGLHIGALAASVPSVYRSLLVEIETLIAQGVYPPGTPQIHGLAEAPAVLHRLESGETRGKHALDPWRQYSSRRL
ncbi:hypothetical protein [Streptomyces paradoxus]|uniref:hypothetical protein n=1 Tax=Streptomyces paradoxus TaxID=66375 RepID=UPI0037CCF7DC